MLPHYAIVNTTWYVYNDLKFVELLVLILKHKEWNKWLNEEIIKDIIETKKKVELNLELIKNEWCSEEVKNVLKDYIVDNKDKWIELLDLLWNKERKDKFLELSNKIKERSEKYE